MCGGRHGRPQLLTPWAPPGLALGSVVTVPPTIFSHVPLGTRIHACFSPSILAVPAHALFDVPQSFLPALATPAHFSMSPLAASALWLPAASPMASSPAMALRRARSVLFMVTPPSVVGGGDKSALSTE